MQGLVHWPRKEIHQVRALVSLLASAVLLSGCWGAFAPVSSPHKESIEALQIGETTREQVRRWLGQPKDQNLADSIEQGDSLERWDVYFTTGWGLSVSPPLPIIAPIKDTWAYVLLIRYDANDRVIAFDEGSGVYPGGPCAAGICYAAAKDWWGSDISVAFPSADDGGPADAAWFNYLSTVRSTVTSGIHSGEWTGSGHTANDLCESAEAGHPCAAFELGLWFWGREAAGNTPAASYCRVIEGLPEITDIPHDKLKACAWFTVALESMPEWCLDVLAESEVRQVKEQVKHFDPKVCYKQIAPYRCGFIDNKICDDYRITESSRIRILRKLAAIDGLPPGKALPELVANVDKARDIGTLVDHNDGDITFELWNSMDSAMGRFLKGNIDRSCQYLEQGAQYLSGPTPRVHGEHRQVISEQIDKVMTSIDCRSILTRADGE
jgi:hypothetical protein